LDLDTSSKKKEAADDSDSSNARNFKAPDFDRHSQNFINHSEYVSLLGDLKNLRWNFRLDENKTKEEKTMERKRMVEICSQLAIIGSSKVLKKFFSSNYLKLKEYVDIFPAKFIMEGENCLCDDGKLGNCQRFIWNCQLAYHSQYKGFCAQRNRCVVRARMLYDNSKQERETIPEKYKASVAVSMRSGDIKKKKNSAASNIWLNFVVPPLSYYQAIIQQMDLDYDGKCPCCLKPKLIFVNPTKIIYIGWYFFYKTSSDFTQKYSDLLN
jgi:hypothetical protein